MKPLPRPPVGRFSVDHGTRRITLRWQDGIAVRLPFIWFRHAHNFPTLGSPEAPDPDRYREIEDPDVPQVSGISTGREELTIHWSHDCSTSKHPLDDLYRHSLAISDRRRFRSQPVLWQRRDAEKFRWFRTADIHDPEGRLAICLQVRDYGIALVRGADTAPGSLPGIAERFGPVRRTHFGELFDIRALPHDRTGTGANIGATASSAQAPHMDEGWRYGPPGISFFHCLKSVGDGASFFVDGICAAETLRREHPDSFEVLTNMPVLWSVERNPEERFRMRVHMIVVDDLDVVRGVRVNDRSMPPLDVPEARQEETYRSIRHFLRIIYRKDMEFVHLFQPGEMAIFDNHRILHARRSFDASRGERWIQQLSIDREEFHNVFRQLAERQGRSDIARWEPDAGLLSQR